AVVLRTRAVRRMTLATMRVTLLPVIPVTALLPVMATVGLGEKALLALGNGLGRRLQSLERVRARHEIRGKRHHRQPLACRALNVPEIAALVGAAESNRDAVSSGTRGTTDAVHILLRHVGQVEIHHMAYAGDIDPT